MAPFCVYRALQAVAEDDFDILLLQGNETGQDTPGTGLAGHRRDVFVIDAEGC